jgi:hypothetical protein
MRTPLGRGLPRRITVSSCAALLTGAGLLIMAGCSGAAGSSAGSASSGSGSDHAALGERAAAPAPVPAGKGAFAAANGTASVAGASGAEGSVTVARLTPAQSIIYTAQVTVRVKNAQRTAALAMSDVTAAGGYTAAEQSQAGRRGTIPAEVTLTLKVPSTPLSAYQGALADLARLGRETALSEQSSDVTEQVADVASRVASSQAEIAQLRGLLKRAGSVSGLLQVQQQLGADESSLEALQAQQRALDRETTYATITASLVGPRGHAPAQHQKGHHGGFVGGLLAGWHGLVRTTTWVLKAIGALLPFAVVIANLGGLGLVLWRRLARRRVARQGPAPTEAG